jgi:hypothetical protein
VTTVCRRNIENKHDEDSLEISKFIDVLQFFDLVAWSFPHQVVRNDGSGCEHRWI